MKRTRLLILALLLIAAVLCLSACGKDADGPRVITGSGTEDDPWQVGADEQQNVTAVLLEDCLMVNGDGDMMDFESAEQRPWNDVLADLTQINIGDEVHHVGSLAFAGAGANADNFDAGFYGNVLSIGDRAFEGANFNPSAILTIPESVKSVGHRAFADTGLAEMYIDGTPEIADDAFAGLTARVCVRYDGTWDESNMLGYGGELSYVYTYAVSYTEDYGTEDLTGEGTIYYPADAVFEYNAVDYAAEEGYRFVRYELISGDLELADPTDPQISTQLTGNVELKIIYEPK